MEDHQECAEVVAACVHVLDGTAKHFERNDVGDCVCDDCIEQMMAGTHDINLLQAVCPDCLGKSLLLAEYRDRAVRDE